MNFLPRMSSVAEATTNMLTTYHELNGDIDSLDEEPSPLAFIRYVSKNRPVVVRRGCSKWRAVRKWNVDYLKEMMKDKLVKVAVTPHGLVRYCRNSQINPGTDVFQSNADSAVTSLEDGLTYFVKPFELVRATLEQIVLI